MKTYLTLLLFFLFATSFAQETDRSWRIGAFSGLASYQGDLQPNSFSFSQSNYMVSLWLRKSLSNRLSVKGGGGWAKLGAADRNNRAYLKPRNLSFQTGITEGFLLIDYTLLDLTNRRLTPYGYFGISIFHFNPYTFDEAGTKVFLKPLSTEGQGLPQYPDRRPYSLWQQSLAFGGGMRFQLNDHILLSADAGQRKTFTDYIDDVSSTYVSPDVLRAERGQTAVDLAYRSDEYYGNSSSPAHGEQRGTPKEMDWYYYMGLSVEVNLKAFNGAFKKALPKRQNWYDRRCPRNVF